MKNQWKWLIAAVSLVVVLVLAVVLYRSLSDRFLHDPQADDADLTEVQTQEAETTNAPESVPFDDASEPDEPAIPEKTTAPEENAAPEDEAAPEKTTTPEPPSTTKAPEPEPPKELANDFVVVDKNNAEVRLSDHFGTPLVVNFWASWCGPCCRELPAFDAAAKQYAGKIDFMMVNLTDGYSETFESVNAFIAENGYTFPVYYDVNEDGANAYSVYSIPLTVFIRADGTVMDSHIGSMDETTLQSYLVKLTA